MRPSRARAAGGAGAGVPAGGGAGEPTDGVHTGAGGAGGSRASIDTTSPLVRVDALAVGYGGAPVLSGVRFAVRPGERIGLLGPNGGGKTTLFRALTGELRPSAGVLERVARCGVVPQTERSRLDYPVSALDVALMGTLSRLPWWRRPGRAERRDAHAALARVGLGALAGETFGELSGGQRQRVLVARALVQEARLLLFDEPFTGLDRPSGERLAALIDALAAEGRGILIATHDVEQARGWDLVLCLNRRQIAFGPPARTLSLPVLEATYGGAIVALPGDGGEQRGILPPHHHEHGDEHHGHDHDHDRDQGHGHDEGHGHGHDGEPPGGHGAPGRRAP